MNDKSKNKIVMVTGLSGAGMSSVLKTLEDLGFEVFDNFPLPLVEALLADTAQDGHPVAIGIDVRSRGFEAQAVLDAAEKAGAQLLFITCDDAVLQKRFTETRRRHPLAKDQSVEAGIRQERALLSVLEDEADYTIDTTALSIHDLKHALKEYAGSPPQAQLSVGLTSFGYKHGLPRAADIVMDVRFLTNPYWSPLLRDKTGKDADIKAFIESDPAFQPFLTNFENLMDVLLPRYAAEGKSYLTIAIGCTGGRHRSVFTVETLRAWLEDKGIHPHVEHRDLGK